MNAEDFLQRVEKTGGDLADYLGEVAQEADQDQIRNRSVALTLLFGVAAYAMYRMAKNYFDHQRGLGEAELRQLMLDQVEVLVEAKWTRDKALAAVQAVSKDIASLPPDSPALKAALTLLRQETRLRSIDCSEEPVGEPCPKAPARTGRQSSDHTRSRRPGVWRENRSRGSPRMRRTNGTRASGD